MTERVHVVCTSHWDREWYLSAERFRFRLVQTIDAVLELLERYPTYSFTLDGQSIVLEDYLELRPEREPDLRRYLMAGRLRAGPWYVQPDEFLVSAEALRRNLRLGCELVRQLGGQPVLVGYLPDAFGHLANLPAILRDAGIDSAIFTRGSSAAVNALGDLFTWQAPDGSSITAHRQPIGYGMTLAHDSNAAQQQLGAALSGLRAEARGQNLLLQLGSDHSRPQASVPELIERLGEPFVFSDHQAYMEAVQASGLKLETYRGELRSGQYHPLLSATLSARLYLKQRNYALDDRLRFSTETLMRLAEGYGLAPSEAFLRRAWKLLLQNHPHDSICGCSVDAVHDEMDVRSQQAESIATELEQDALARLSKHPDHAGRWLVLNPCGATQLEGKLLLCRSEIESGRLLVGGQPAQLESVQSALVSTLAGPVSALPEWLEQLEDRHPVRFLRWEIHGRHLRAEVDEGPRHPDCPAAEQLLQAAIAAQVETVELHVFRTDVTLGAKLLEPHTAIQSLPIGFSPSEPVAPPHSAPQLVNQHLRLEVNAATGTLTVTELDSGRVWNGLHRLVDVGDRGDTYTFSAVPDAPIAAKLLRASVTATGPVYSSLELQYRLSVPARLEATRTRRSAELRDLEIITEVRLWQGARHLEFSTHFVNTAEDHLLRAHFPGAGAGSWADSAEAIVQRPEFTPGPQTHDWADQPADHHPLAHWAAKHTLDSYWGVAARGLSEYGQLEGLSLTLLRAVGWLSRDDLPERPSQAGPPYPVPGAQCLRPITAQYAWFATQPSLEALNAAALGYAHPARGWLVPAPAI